jgi:hypothetical protein
VHNHHLVSDVLCGESPQHRRAATDMNIERDFVDLCHFNFSTMVRLQTMRPKLCAIAVFHVFFFSAEPLCFLR